jgi:hypothetical protein
MGRAGNPDAGAALEVDLWDPIVPVCLQLLVHLKSNPEICPIVYVSVTSNVLLY